MSCPPEVGPGSGEQALPHLGPHSGIPPAGTTPKGSAPGPSSYDAAVLEDGSYDVVVVDATEGGGDGDVALELAVLSGEHKGEMVKVTAVALGRDPLDLLAVPATLAVEGGIPRVVLEG
ncbi:MAG: hypothetical protein JWM89_3834 [Acidimicrobiales bacterium]|nr:hypothetical protein [Acidimicrobiales bacterium]